MGSDGVLVGRIAHIEAALPDGPRFRASMSNDERRGFDNLLLLCGTHHDIVDQDLTKWTVSALKDLKKRHEAIYTGVIDLLQSTVGDSTEGTEWRPAQNLKRLLQGPDFTAEEMAGSLEVINGFAERLAAVPIGARSLLALVVSRGSGTSGGGIFEEVSIPMPVLEQLADCSTSDLISHINVLDHFELAYIDTEVFEGPVLVIVGNSTPTQGWPILAKLREMAGDDSTLIRQALVHLDFTVFDADTAVTE